MYSYRGSVRRTQNVCTVCKTECDPSSSFVCNDCVEPTHAFCIGMTDELIREFKRKTMKFCCPVCSCISKKRKLDMTGWRVSTGTRRNIFWCSTYHKCDLIWSNSTKFYFVHWAIAFPTIICVNCLVKCEL